MNKVKFEYSDRRKRIKNSVTRVRISKNMGLGYDITLFGLDGFYLIECYCLTKWGVRKYLKKYGIDTKELSL